MIKLKNCLNFFLKFYNNQILINHIKYLLIHNKYYKNIIFIITFYYNFVFFIYKISYIVCKIYII